MCRYDWVDKGKGGSNYGFGCLIGGRSNRDIVFEGGSWEIGGGS